MYVTFLIWERWQDVESVNLDGDLIDGALNWWEAQLRLATKYDSFLNTAGNSRRYCLLVGICCARPDGNPRLVTYPFVRARSRIKALLHATRMVVAWKLSCQHDDVLFLPLITCDEHIALIVGPSDSVCICNACPDVLRFWSKTPSK